MIFWLLMENYFEEDNSFKSAGHFCDREVDMRHLGMQWLSYKGATRISDTVYDELAGTGFIERQYFKSRNGTQYYKYRIPQNVKRNLSDLPEQYAWIRTEFKKVIKRDNTKHE